MTSRAASARMAQEASRWFVADAEGNTILVTNHLDDPVLVEWDETNGGWTCATCGCFPVGQTAGPTCHHVMAAGRSLSLRQSLSMIRVVVNKAGRTLAPPKGPTGTAKAERALAAHAPIDRSGSAKRAAEAARHDERHQGMVGEVTGRRATDDDRARLDERGRRKRIG